MIGGSAAAFNASTQVMLDGKNPTLGSTSALDTGAYALALQRCKWKKQAFPEDDWSVYSNMSALEGERCA